MLGARSIIQKPAPPSTGEILFLDDLSGHPANRELITLTPTNFGAGYTVMPESSSDVGLQTFSGGGYAINAGVLGNDRGNYATPTPGSEWGTGYQAITARIFFPVNSGSTSRFSLNSRNHINDDDSLTIKDGITFLLENLWDTTGMRIRVSSRDNINLLWDDGWKNYAHPNNVIWIRLETEPKGGNTVRVAAGFYIGDTFPTNPGDWTINTVPQTVPIYSEANDLTGWVIRTRDLINNMRLRFARIDTFRYLGV